MKPFSVVFLGPPDPVSGAGRGQHLKLPMHQHDSLEIAFLERGHVTWMVEDQPSEVHEGMIFYTFPWEAHGSANEYDTGHYFYFVLLRGDQVDPYKRPMSFQSLGLKKSVDAELMRILESTSRRSWPASERLVMTIKELVNETMNPKVRSEEIRSALTKFLLLELARVVSEEGTEPPPKVHTPPKIKKLIRELQVHPENKWTLPDMAATCGLHLTHFTKAFRHATGDTPMVYLRRLRINRAREMLQTEAAVTEIAFACGFESSQHFARIFREFTGKSASEYRKNPSS